MARRLMLQCLQSKPGSPPNNALAAEPVLASLIQLYYQAKNFQGALPDGGGLLDMRVDHYHFFAVFAEAEAIYLDTVQQS